MHSKKRQDTIDEKKNARGFRRLIRIMHEWKEQSPKWMVLCFLGPTLDTVTQGRDRSAQEKTLTLLATHFNAYL
jgi:hypothetical protein